MENCDFNEIVDAIAQAVKTIFTILNKK